MKRDKVAQTTHNPNETLTTEFQIGEHEPIDAVLVEPQDTEPMDYVVGVQETNDADGNRGLRWLKLRPVMESRRAVVEFYDSHEKLINSIGATTVVGIVAVGSLFVRRHKRD